MKLENSFFEDEVRDGFYIPAMVKKAWAAELSVLAEFDRVCKKHNITYFADWGTLLAAVRHEGFIPWDDDLDVSMKRADYERFLAVADKELPEGYTVINFDRHEDFFELLARVTSRPRICFDEDYLEEFHGFPYMAGIDIFLLDYVSPDEEKEKKRCEDAKFVLAVADAIGTDRIGPAALEESLKKIERQWGILIDRRKSDHDKKVQLYHLIERIFSLFPEAGATELTQLMPWGLKGTDYRLPKKYYEKSLRLPYENLTIPVPTGYDAMLRRRYGDYMKLVRSMGGHDYPYFASQKKSLEDVMGEKLPEYAFSKEQLVRQEPDRSGSLKVLADECRAEFSRQMKELEKLLGGDAEASSENGAERPQGRQDAAGQIQDLLQGMQQLAIDLGNLIEQVKGEGYVTVRTLEDFCEKIFRLFETCGSDGAFLADAGDDGEGALHANYEELKKSRDRVSDSIDRDILQRREIVFLPFKAEHWRAMKSVWLAACEDENCDVYVIPVPYYYKKYDNSLCDMQYDLSGYPKEVELTAYDAFDFGLHCPEVIVTQNPYDEWNPSMSVHTFFYSSNLRNFTEKQVYLPYFQVEEFDRDCEREYANMQYYCTMPGVVLADQVIVQSENMRSLYIKKLTEFAGEDTREIWEQKISGVGTPLADGSGCGAGQAKAGLSSGAFQGEAGREIPQIWRDIIYREDGSRRKVVLYAANACGILEEPEAVLEKMRQVFSVFKAHKEETSLIFRPHPALSEAVQLLEHDQQKRCRDLIDSYRSEGWGIYDEGMEQAALLNIIDAYYGDGGALAMECRLLGKPCVLQNV